jgi:hypothetical protein
MRDSGVKSILYFFELYVVEFVHIKLYKTTRYKGMWLLAISNKT